ncbi:hypothetical protein [Streptomyces sp. NPDC002054]|uniref:hypothetical protein n=1 Tax=Streptomyces sp. NPDC002054 TaxID=3154663 RepID=UPI00331CAFA3
MTTAPSVPPLFTELVDDAGLFPPEALTMAVASTRHRRDKAAGHPVLTHRFLCASKELVELLAAVGPEDPFRLGLITPLDTEAVYRALALIAEDPRIELALVEGPLPDGPDPVAAARRAVTALGALPEGVPGHVEVPLTGDQPSVPAVLRVLAEGGKAVCRLVDGGTEDAAVAALRSTDTTALVAEAHQISPATASTARNLFVSYGSCSTSEPIEDLRALGLLEKEKEKAA